MKLETLKNKIKEKKYPKIGDIFFDIIDDNSYAVWVIKDIEKSSVSGCLECITKLIWESGGSGWNPTFRPDVDVYLEDTRLKFIGNIKDHPEFFL